MLHLRRCPLLQLCTALYDHCTNVGRAWSDSVSRSDWGFALTPHKIGALTCSQLLAEREEVGVQLRCAPCAATIHGRQANDLQRLQVRDTNHQHWTLLEPHGARRRPKQRVRRIG
jgi:hypothetical protein